MNNLTEEDYKKLFIEIRTVIAASLDAKIQMVIEGKLNTWFETNLEKRFDEVIKKEFEKIIIAKLR